MKNNLRLGDYIVAKGLREFKSNNVGESPLFDSFILLLRGGC